MRMTPMTLSVSEARRQLNSLDQTLEECHVIYVTRHGRTVFAIVALSYFAGLMETLEILADPEAMTMLQEAIDDIRTGRLRDHEDVKKELL